MENVEMHVNDNLSYDDAMHDKHGIRGHIQIFRRNKTTKETSLWYEGDNVVTATGYSFIFNKILNLYLDSSHGHSYDRPDKDTTLVTPDLNETSTNHGMGIGVDPDSYSVMDTNISENHFIQGFMVGTGGSGEDTITAKNTNYSFTKLRNPIPFQQTQQQTGLTGSLAGKYCGVLRTSSATKSYFIKRFDETPHIYHSWWHDGQKWDEIDPVTRDDLGPDATHGVDKTTRIQTYAECKLTIDEPDFVSYFNNTNNPNETPMINELGLVAFDVVAGSRTIIENCYNRYIQDLLFMVFDKSKDSISGAEKTKFVNSVRELATTILNILTPPMSGVTQSNLANFMMRLSQLTTAEASSYPAIRTALSGAANINVEAMYNQNNTLQYTTDKFLTYLGDVSFTTEDEAQRIKLITYYTFNSLPIESNWELLIDYRLYAN